jgi:hypothetical protein
MNTANFTAHMIRAPAAISRSANLFRPRFGGSWRPTDAQVKLALGRPNQPQVASASAWATTTASGRAALTRPGAEISPRPSSGMLSPPLLIASKKSRSVTLCGKTGKGQGAREPPRGRGWPGATGGAAVEPQPALPPCDSPRRPRGMRASARRRLRRRYPCPADPSPRP